MVGSLVYEVCPVIRLVPPDSSGPVPLVVQPGKTEGSYFSSCRGYTESRNMSMATVSVHALSTGHLTLPERSFVFPADADARRTVPSLSFLIQHHSAQTTTRVVFDLGIRRSTSLYPEPLQKHCESRTPMSTTPDVVESLAKGNLTVDDIHYVIFSHVHYDHVGYPRDFTNPSTAFVVGPGTLMLLSGETKLNIGSHSFFEDDLLPPDRTIELSSPGVVTKDMTRCGTARINTSSWSTALDPFPHSIDAFGDSSMYIISAPGHLPGHINLLCRTSESKYILLAGDSCHDIRLFNGTHSIATWQDEGRTCCIHYDIPAAEKTISRLAQVSKSGIVIDGRKYDVEVVFAHNWEWECDAITRGRFWPGSL